MHREHSASLNPKCALRAPFVFHTFHLSLNVRKNRRGGGVNPPMSQREQNKQHEHNAHVCNDENTP